MKYKLLGQSYACHTGARVSISERGVKIALQNAPSDAKVTVGKRSFRLNDGVAIIPPSAFVIGINRVSFTIGGESIPAESIIKTGEGLSPSGISATDAILALDRRITELSARLNAAELSLKILMSEEGLFE